MQHNTITIIQYILTHSTQTLRQDRHEKIYERKHRTTTTALAHTGHTGTISLTKCCRSFCALKISFRNFYTSIYLQLHGIGLAQLYSYIRHATHKSSLRESFSLFLSHSRHHKTPFTRHQWERQWLWDGGGDGRSERMKRPNKNWKLEHIVLQKGREKKWETGHKTTNDNDRLLYGKWNAYVSGSKINDGYIFIHGLCVVNVNVCANWCVCVCNGPSIMALPSHRHHHHHHRRLATITYDVCVYCLQTLSSGSRKLGVGASWWNGWVSEWMPCVRCACDSIYTYVIRMRSGDAKIII